MELNQTLTCKNCGGELLPADRNRNGYRCRYCGSFNVDDIKDLPEAEMLYIQADSDRDNYKFDDAIARYRKAIEFAPYADRYYWGLMLAEYGVVYVKDYDNSLKPTFNRASVIAVCDNENYKNTINNCSEKDREDYLKQAEILEKTRCGIIEEIRKEKEPYHIFISFKKTTGEKDKSGEPILTKDYTIANNLYHQLNNLGYKVFFSEISLAYEKGNYEANIYTAINQSKVMIVIATNPDYLKTIWVQNEILRFKERMIPNSELDLIPICNNNNTITLLPFSLGNYQAINLEQNPMGIDDILLNRLKKTFRSRINIAPKSIIEKKEFKANTKYEKMKEIEGEKLVRKEFSKITTAIEIPENEELKLRKAEKYIEMDRLDYAKDLYNGILDDNPMQFFANIGIFLMNQNVKNLNELVNKVAYKQTDLDFEKYEKIISLAPNRENALKCINALYDITMLLIRNGDERRLRYYVNTIPWIDDSQLQTINKTFKDLYKSYLTPAILNEFLTVMKIISNNNAQVYFNTVKEIGDYCLSKANYVCSKALYEECMKLKEDSSIKWNYMLSVLECSEENLYKNIGKLQDHSIIERLILSCKDRNSAFYYIDSLISTAIRLIDIKDTESAKTLFNETVCWIDMDTDIRMNYILRFADRLLNNGLFEEAKVYYNEVLSLNIKESKAHWGLLKCRIHAKTDTEIINKEENLLDLQEFHNAINCEDKEFEVFMDIAKKQQDNIKTKNENKINEEKKKEEEIKKIRDYKKKIKLKNIIIFLIILNALSVLLIAVFSKFMPALSLLIMFIDLGLNSILIPYMVLAKSKRVVNEIIKNNKTTFLKKILIELTAGVTAFILIICLIFYNTDIPAFQFDYNPIYYNIDYDLNYEGKEIHYDYDLNEIEELVLMEPVRNGYKFRGWYLDEELTVPFNRNCFDSDHKYYKFYAKWEQRAYNFDTAEEIFVNNITKLNFNYQKVFVFKFIPEKSQYYTIYTKGNIDTIGYIYNSNGVKIYEQDDFYNDKNFIFVCHLNSNQFYYIKVITHSNSGECNLFLED